MSLEVTDLRRQRMLELVGDVQLRTLRDALFEFMVTL